MYKISVIMGIYNGEEYLENSLKSIINQTIGFKNIELILVDDNSTDNSINIINEYSNKYPNIKPIFLEENSGCPGIPRNIGIKNATSNYIMFIDDDDEYFPEICDKLYNTLISEEADIVACNWLNEYDEKGIVYSGELCLKDKEIIYFKNRSVWNCIYKKSIITDNNINFLDLNLAEDVIFQLNYALHAKKLIYLNDFIGYNYIPRNDSISSPSVDSLISDIKASYILARILKENKCDLSRYFKQEIQQFILGAIIHGENNEKKEIEKVLSNLSDFENEINFNGKLTIDLQFINFFILHRKLNIATHLCLFISKVKKSNLILNIYRKFFLKFHRKN